MAVIAITGASGFVGAALSTWLQQRGHRVHHCVRGAPRQPLDIRWDPDTGALGDAIEAVEVVVHLAGANIAAGRWHAGRMRAIADSRGPVTERLCRALARLRRPPALLCASAVGFYGDRGDEALDEGSAAGRGFLADVTRAWEDAVQPLRACGARTVSLRLGMVLGHGGALAKMLPAFRWGLGGRLGHGRQYVSWIAMADLLGAVEYLLLHDLAGPFVCTSPHPVTNREFVAALGRVLRRPAVLPVPAPLLRLLLGKMADEVLLASQRALPRRLLAAGFVFRHPQLDGALAAAVRGAVAHGIGDSPAPDPRGPEPPRTYG